MLNIKVTIEGDRVFIEGLENFKASIPGAIERGLNRVGSGVERLAHAWLFGPVRHQVTKKTRPRGQYDLMEARPGGYPVPRVSDGLIDALHRLGPGESGGDRKTLTAGPLETIIFDDAPYANVIHEGLRSFAKFGPRRFLTDALNQFNQGAEIERIMKSEIDKELDKLK
jgi:hypothetical protein